MFREPAEKPLKEGLVQAELSSRIARDDGSELLVVPDQHHLLRVAGHDGDHAVGLRTHAALVDHHLRCVWGIIIIMKICKAPTLRLKALNRHTHIMYIEMENVIKKEEKRRSIYRQGF